MGKLLAGVVIGGLIVYAYHRVHRPESEVPVQEQTLEQGQSQELLPAVEVATPAFRCDGRTHCSQMTSCEEATYFLQNCPGVKMDGERDGVPCEKQWCGRQ